MVKILIVRTETELAEMLSQLEKADTYCLDTETLDRGLFDLSLVGLSLSFDGKRGFYIPTGHAEESAQLPAELVLERMKPILERPGKMCLMHNEVRPRSSEGVRWDRISAGCRVVLFEGEEVSDL